MENILRNERVDESNTDHKSNSAKNSCDKRKIDAPVNLRNYGFTNYKETLNFERLFMEKNNISYDKILNIPIRSYELEDSYKGKY